MIPIKGKRRLGAIRDVLNAEEIRFEELTSQSGAKQKQVFWLIYYAGQHYLAKANTIKNAIQCLAIHLEISAHFFPSQYSRVKIERIPLHQ